MTKHSPIFQTETVASVAIAACLAAQDCLRFHFDGAERNDGVIARLSPAGAPAAATMADLQDSLTGVTPQTMVLAADGWRPAGEIVVGDLLRTPSGQLSAVLSVERRDFGWRALGVNPLLQPVRISQGALGPSFPAEDVFLAPGQKVQTGHDDGGQGQVARALVGQVVGQPVGQGATSRCVQRAVTYLSLVLADGPFVLLPAGWMPEPVPQTQG